MPGPRSTLKSAVRNYAAAARSLLSREDADSSIPRWAAFSTAVGSALGLVGTSAASIIYSGPQNILVTPSTNNGFYLNMDGAGGAELQFGFEGTGTPIINNGAWFGGTASMLLNQPTGGFTFNAVRHVQASTVISAAQNYFNGSGHVHTYSPWAASFIGVRFAGNFGWVRVSGNASDEWTIHDWAYEDSGNPIHAGTTSSGGGGVVPEPSMLALSLVAMGSSAVLAMRRRRAAKKVEEADAVSDS